MSAGIKRCERRKAIYRSVSESCAFTSQERLSDERFSVQPCSGPNLTSFELSEGTGSDTMETLRKSIIKEIQSEIKKIIDPLIDEIKQLRQDVQTQKSASNNEALNHCVRAECSAIAQSVSGPQGLSKETEEAENIYHDASEMAPRSALTAGIDNLLYVSLQENAQVKLNNDSDVREEAQGCVTKCRNKSNGNTKPKEVRSNSLQTKVKTVKVPPRPRSAIHIKKVFDERECLANALQFHIKELVEGLIFHDSELPDFLLADGCLTEDECSDVRKLRDRKDQIRILLTLVKGRDFHVLQSFLKHVKSQNPDVAQMIHAKFEKNKTDGIKGKLCALCKLKKQFNVKHAADGLWSIEAIDDELYNKIVCSEAPIGAQRILWEEVIQSLTMLDTQKAERAHKELISDLSCKNMFVHLADGVNDMLIKSHSKLTCSCEPKLCLPKRNLSFGATTSAESNLPDSLSEDNSNDSSSNDGTDSIETQGSVCGYTDVMSVIKEVNESTLSSARNVHNPTYKLSKVADTIPPTVVDNNPSSSKFMPSPMENPPNGSSIVKKPVPPAKPAVLIKQQNTKYENISKNINLHSRANTAKSIAVNRTDDREDIIPPLPKKKIQNAKQFYENNSGHTEERVNSIPPLPKKKNQNAKQLCNDNSELTLPKTDD